MTDTLVERVAQSLWHAAPSNLAGCFRMWNEASDQDKAAFRLMAQSALKAQASRIAELEGVLKELDLFFEFERPGLVIAENRGISFRRMSDAFQAAHKALRGKSLERIVCKHGIEDVRCDDCYGEGLANGL